MSDNSSDDPKELYEKAEEFIDRDDFLKASECLNKALEIDPNYTEAMMKLGYVHMRLEFKRISIDHIFIKDEQVLWYNSYETNFFRERLSALYNGLIIAIFFIIFGIIFTIQFGFFYLFFFIFAFPGIFIALRGFIKIVSIKNKLISIPDDPR
jgi:tetratricopeptide (TPR) repeat protein